VIYQVTFRKLGAVIVLVSDIDKSIRFYHDILGLPIKNRSDEWTEFFSYGTVLALHPKNNKEKLKTGTNILVGLMVSDFEYTVDILKRRNVKFFKEPKEEPFGKHTIIEDPDGHLISIAQIETKSTEGFDLIGLVGAE
jgi:lactoylglutathione lyase